MPSAASACILHLAETPCGTAGLPGGMGGMAGGANMSLQALQAQLFGNGGGMPGGSGAQ